MRGRFLISLATAVWASGVGAAELPSRTAKTKPGEEKARACQIAGEPGVETAGGGCVRISGYVGVGVSTGNVKH